MPIPCACTCPVGDDCKHAVAVLLSLRPRLGTPGGGRTGTPGWEQQLEELADEFDRIHDEVYADLGARDRTHLIRTALTADIKGAT